jgi:outer membrane protein OmpA-like peptidoglycan-associated protein
MYRYLLRMITTPWLRRWIPALLLVCGMVASLHGQQTPAKADALYRAGAYEDAARIYARHLKRHKSLQGNLQLARCYKALGENSLAEARYTDVVFDPKVQPEHYLEFGKHLKTMGKYGTARAWFMKYADNGPDSLLGFRWARSCDLATAYRADSLAWVVTHTGEGNGKSSDLSPVWYRNGILFATNRQRGFFVRFFNSKSKEAFYDLYFSELSPDGRLGKPKYQRDNLNTRFHDGPIAVPPSENVAYITRTNTEGLGTSRDAAGFSRVNVYRIEQHIDRWRKGSPVPYTTAEYNIAHPAVSADGRTLYFASDMPGGYGGTDLYVSQLLPTGWTKPENLGPQVNTEANEGYPYISGDSSIYFASDRAEGLGGKDIFTAQRRHGTWTNVRNAGYPLNTPYDDFGFCISPSKPLGFFTSNRPGGVGDDDIWAFKRFKRIEATFVDAITGLPIRDLRVTFTDLNQKVSTQSTNEEGQVSFTLRTGQEVYAKAEIDGYESWKELLSTRKLGADEDLYKIIPLIPQKQFIVEGVITDAATQQALEKTVVRVIGPQEERRFTDAAGKYAVGIADNEHYTIIYEREGYVPFVQDLQIQPGTAPQHYRFDAALKKGTALLVEGQTYDPERQIPMGNVAVEVVKAANHQVLKTVNSRADGLFWLVLDEGRDYNLLASQQGHFTATANLLRDSLTSDTAHVKLNLAPLKPGEVFHTIYYAYGKSDVASMGKSDLQALASLLKANPDIRIELSSHTDSRGSSSYNKTLSQKRANQALDYLASLGVDRKRVDAIGFGEERLHNNCGDGVTCSEELHAQNRRTELRVIAAKPAAAPAGKTELKGTGTPSGKDAIKDTQLPDAKELLKSNSAPATPQDGTLQALPPKPDSLQRDSAGLGQQAPFPGTYRDVGTPWRAPAVKLF